MRSAARYSEIAPSKSLLAWSARPWERCFFAVSSWTAVAGIALKPRRTRTIARAQIPCGKMCTVGITGIVVPIGKEPSSKLTVLYLLPRGDDGAGRTYHRFGDFNSWLGPAWAFDLSPLSVVKH